jgi:probable HAF family extracellular repeat protein
MKPVRFAICCLLLLVVARVPVKAELLYDIFDLATLSEISVGYGLSGLGEVTGVSYGGSFQHAFLYSGGVMQDLGGPAVGISEGRGVNNSS